MLTLRSRRQPTIVGNTPEPSADLPTIVGTQLPLGASYFPGWMKVAWRVSLEDSMVYVAMLNKAKTRKTMERLHGLSPCLISYFENGNGKT